MILHKREKKLLNRKLLFVVLSTLLIVGFIGCSRKEPVQEHVMEMDFEQLLEAAKGTTVTFYGWGGSEQTNSWIDGYLSENMKKEYAINIKRVGMNIDEILNKLLNEKQLDVKSGNIDVVWINGENFFTARKNNLLFGPFVGKLPNFNKYIDREAPDIRYDFGCPVEGYEAPFGKAQLVMVYDVEKVKAAPADSKALLEFAKNNPGKFTYPAPPDFTGSAFVRNIICDIVGYERFLNMEADEAAVREAAAPAMEYLKELKPYLWQGGKTYPSEAPLLDNMYADGEVWMTMTYHPNEPSGKIETGEFKESTRTFVFDNGTIGNTHFLAIPFNSPNKAGAMALINYILKVESQASKYFPSTWGDLPVLDNSKLNPEEKELFKSMKLGAATLPQDILSEKRIPEMPAALIPIIEKIWMEEIPGEGE